MLRSLIFYLTGLDLALQPNAKINPMQSILKQRRQALADLIDDPVILWSGGDRPRNFPANSLPFRASSHFLYFAGLSLTNAAILLDTGRLTLFWDDPAPAAELWHGITPQRQDWADQMGADAHLPLADLATRAAGAATIPVQDGVTREHQVQILGRALPPATALEGIDFRLAEAIVTLRLQHDQAAIAQLRAAAQITVAAHLAGMEATAAAPTEAAVRAAMEFMFLAHNFTCAYNSIVSIHGEVLHNPHYHHAVQAGDLLLADVGAETQAGWAADVTRTWPVAGSFSSTQRDLYEVVLAAHDACIARVAPGVEFREIHLLAATELAAGLVDLGILKGQPEELVARDAHALFFPHGVGHLLGLDVHDMEDLGDLAGYAPGRVRSDRFGLCFLRLDRPLQSGMVVTIEPGFYQVSAILKDPQRRSAYRDCVNWDRLVQFRDVRGIRIEDDVLVTETGCEVLTAGLPTTASGIMASLNPR
jgi:Xaa-Pro aminopeptidase